jgi:predicted PurR-regulated permease PerM
VQIATAVAQYKLRIATAVLVIAAAVALLPLWPALLLAAWVGCLARPLLQRTTPLLRGRENAAAVLTIGLIVLTLAPLVAAIAMATIDAVELVEMLRTTNRGREVFAVLVSPDAAGPSFDMKQAVTLLQSYGERAWAIAVTLGATATTLLIGLIVFFWGTYWTLCQGPRAYRWFERNSGLGEVVVRRLHGAFVETGRGLLLGVGLTSLLQAVVATIVFAALGVPRPILFGALTLGFSIIPGLGSGFVWAPIAVGLVLTGEPIKALILTVVGVAVIGSVDNLVRPVFARMAHLKMSNFMLFASMIGGVALLGPFGLFVGPLAVRLARETLEILNGDRPSGSFDAIPASGRPGEAIRAG